MILVAMETILAGNYDFFKAQSHREIRPGTILRSCEIVQKTWKNMKKH